MGESKKKEDKDDRETKRQKKEEVKEKKEADEDDGWEEVKVKVELHAAKKKKMVELPVTATVAQIIETYGKRILGPSCVLYFNDKKQDDDVVECPRPCFNTANTH